MELEEQIAANIIDSSDTYLYAYEKVYRLDICKDSIGELAVRLHTLPRDSRLYIYKGDKRTVWILEEEEGWSQEVDPSYDKKTQIEHYIQEDGWKENLKVYTVRMILNHCETEREEILIWQGRAESERSALWDAEDALKLFPIFSRKIKKMEYVSKEKDFFSLGKS